MSTAPQNNSDNSDLLSVIQPLPCLTQPTDRIIDLIDKCSASKQPFFGIEIIPTRSNESDALDFNTFGRLPLFVSVAWFGSQFHGPEAIEISPALRLARKMLKGNGIPLLMHLTCERMTTIAVEQILENDDAANNVLILRGDNVHPDQPMQHAIDLLRFIRSSTRLEHKCLSVAGYPNGHPQSPNIETDLLHLKQKVQAGADFIITQICFSASAILRFIERCRLCGINVPIVVGIYTPSTYAELLTMCRVCGLSIDDAEVAAEFKRYAGDGESFRNYSVKRTRCMLDTLMANGVLGFQFFTMNRFELLSVHFNLFNEGRS